MKYYELTYLISPETKEEELKSFSQKINGLVQERSGILDKAVGPIKKNLAYPIKKKMFGYLQTLNFYLEPEKLEDFKKAVRTEGKILRFIVLGKKIAKAKKRKPKIAVRKISRLARKKEEPKKEKIELEKIDKKLEEILGEI